MKHFLSRFLLAFVLISHAMLGHASDSEEEEQQKMLADSLIYQAYFGDAASTRELLRKGADPNTRDEHDWPVLAVAADRSDKQAYPIAYALIRAGADINAGHERNYPIINAIKNKNASLVALLVSEDVHLRVRGPDGLTAYQNAQKMKHPAILYFLEKEFFEQAQTQKFLRSKLHLRQLTSQYAFHHCAFQYWGFYLRSKQDQDMDEDAIRERMRKYAYAAQAIGERAAQYFPEIYRKEYDAIADKQRNYISEQLNKMISNRNRRQQGVGKISDLLKRCNINLTPEYFHAIAVK